MNLVDIDNYSPFEINNIKIEPLLVYHGNLPVLGFKFGNFAYITDAKTIPDSTIDLINGIDTLVLNAVRLEEHPTHLSLEEALELFKRLKVKKGYVTHISHFLGEHDTVSKTLPPNVYLAYDTLKITVN